MRPLRAHMMRICRHQLYLWPSSYVHEWRAFATRGPYNRYCHTQETLIQLHKTQEEKHLKHWLKIVVGDEVIKHTLRLPKFSQGQDDKGATILPQKTGKEIYVVSHPAAILWPDYRRRKRSSEQEKNRPQVIWMRERERERSTWAFLCFCLLCLENPFT